MTALLSYQNVFAQNNNIVVKRVQLGDNVISILRAEGFSAEERDIALSKNPNLRRLFLTLDLNYLVLKRPNQTEVQLFEQQKNIGYKVSKNIESKNRGSASAQISVEEFVPKFKSTIKRFEGRVVGSLLGTALQLTSSNWVASRVSDAFVVTHKNRNLTRGSKLWFEVEKKYLDGRFIRFGEVHKVSANFNNEPILKTLIRLEDGAALFANADDVFSKKPLYSPTNYIKISSLFQPRRKHPITGRTQAHLGVDFELPEGASVMAAKTGIVMRTGYNHAAGNFVVLQHASGLVTAYNHLSRILPFAKTGTKIRAGQTFAFVGCTGYCTRAHLHFAVKNHGLVVDPLQLMRPYPYGSEQGLAEKFGTKRKLVATTE